MSKQIKIGFTGNRLGLSEHQKQEITKILNKYDDIIVYHGDCIGADSDFHNICTAYRTKNIETKLKIIICPPDIDTMRGNNKIDNLYGDMIMPTKPYLKRNADIVNMSDILIGCPTDPNKEVLRSGTWSTIRKAKKMNKIIHVF